MFFGVAKVRLFSADAWQFMQYWAKPILGMLLLALAGQSGAQLPGAKPYQPQNQPSNEAAGSRTMIAAPLVGNRCSGSTPTQSPAGAGNISLTMTAPLGTGGTASNAGASAPRLASSQSAISGEYQMTTGAWVPW